MPVCKGKQEEELKAMMESIRTTMGGAKHEGPSVHDSVSEAEERDEVQVVTQRRSHQRSGQEAPKKVQAAESRGPGKRNGGEKSLENKNVPH